MLFILRQNGLFAGYEVVVGIFALSFFLSFCVSLSLQLSLQLPLSLPLSLQLSLPLSLSFFQIQGASLVIFFIFDKSLSLLLLDAALVLICFIIVDKPTLPFVGVLDGSPLPIIVAVDSVNVFLLSFLELLMPDHSVVDSSDVAEVV